MRWAIPAGLLIGLEIVVFAVVLWLLKPTLVRRAPSAGRVVNWASVLALLVGVSLAGINVLTEQTPESSLTNPVKRTVDSIAAGAGLYQASCAACHGVDAHGGGPLSGTTARLGCARRSPGTGRDRAQPGEYRSGHSAVECTEMAPWVQGVDATPMKKRGVWDGRSYGSEA